MTEALYRNDGSVILLPHPPRPPSRQALPSEAEAPRQLGNFLAMAARKRGVLLVRPAAKGRGVSD